MKKTVDIVRIVQCKSCTLQLVELCYARTRWFILFRTPLLWGMRSLGRWHGIDPKDYPTHSEKCLDCIRFLKNALKERSRLFVLLNFCMNPIFNHLRDSIVTAEEKQAAKRFAEETKSLR